MDRNPYQAGDLVQHFTNLIYQNKILTFLCTHFSETSLMTLPDLVQRMIIQEKQPEVLTAFLHFLPL